MRSSSDQGNRIIWVVAAIAGVVAITFVTVVIRASAGRDRWELDNSYRVTAQLDEVAKLRDSDPALACKRYGEILREARQHVVTDAALGHRLAEAGTSWEALKADLEAKWRAEEAERARVAAAEQAKRERVEAEAAKRREEERQAKAEEARRLAEQRKHYEDEKRAAEAVKQARIGPYVHAPKDARDILKALRKLDAKLDIGAKPDAFSQMVGDAWADAKVWIESPEAAPIPEFTFLIESAVQKYKLSIKAWAVLAAAEGHGEGSNKVLQECWRGARRRLIAAQFLISGDDPSHLLTVVAHLHETDANYDSTVRKILPLLPDLAVQHAMARTTADKIHSEETLTKLAEVLKGLAIDDLP